MADKRMIGRAVSQSRKLSKISIKAALIWTWSIPFFDSYGYMEADPDWIKFNIVPRRDDITLQDIAGVLQELARSKLWKLYQLCDSENKIVAFDPKFKDFQTLRPERLGSQRFTPGALRDYSGTTPAQDKINEVKLREVNKDNKPPSLIPTQDQKKQLATICTQLLKKYQEKFNPFQWIQKNITLLPETHIQVLTQLNNGEIINPWAYANKISLTINKDLNAADFQKEADLIKEEFSITAKNFFKGKLP